MPEVEHATASVSALVERVVKFAETRGWRRFHTPKNLASALVVESGELLEIFQWQIDDEPTRPLSEVARAEVESEMADIAMYLFTMCGTLGIDLESAVRRKMQVNEDRFPAEKYDGPWRSRTKGFS